MTDLIRNKIVVITGASSGMGEAAARHLAAQGAKVVLGARRADRLDAVVREIIAAGGEAMAVETDVTDRAAVAHLVDTAVTSFGRIDVLINNAGIMPLSALESLKVDEWDRMIDVNIKGVLYGIAAALPHMKRQRSGQVITTSSVAGHLVFPASAVYSGTKFAVRAICEGFRQEVKDYNIRSTILCPGAVKTELLDHISDEGVRSANSDYVGKVGISSDSFARMAAFAISQPEDVDVNDHFSTDRSATLTQSANNRRRSRSPAVTFSGSTTAAWGIGEVPPLRLSRKGGRLGSQRQGQKTSPRRQSRFSKSVLNCAFSKRAHGDGVMRRW